MFSRQRLATSPAILPALLVCLCWGPGCTQSDQPTDGSSRDLVVISGKEVSLEYTLRLDSAESEPFDTNVGSDPLTYRQGSGQLVPGLESSLEGMAIGESKQVTLSPLEGYGEVNPLHVSEVPKELVPPEARQVGIQVQMKSRHGQPIVAQVKKINDETILLDFNHPLAGKTLFFDVKVLDIKDRSQKM